MNGQVLQEFIQQLLIQHLLCARLYSRHSRWSREKRGNPPPPLCSSHYKEGHKVFPRLGLMGVPDLPSAQPLGWEGHSITCEMRPGQDDFQIPLKRQKTVGPSQLRRQSSHLPLRKTVGAITKLPPHTPAYDRL